MSDSQAVIDRCYMARALKLAAKGLYTTTPNPSVGCVLVKDGKIVGEGYTQPAGGAHGEVMAMNAAGANTTGATAYVTLEPCSHYGRTPPCSNGLIAAGVVRVVAAMEDPNPVVASSGLAKLKVAGVQVESGLLEAQARQFLAGFYQRMTNGVPKVIAKLASSLDGRTAMASGESQWITGREARYQVQKLRAASCAIVTGIDSILQDDSSLTVRIEDWLEPYGSDVVRQPLRVVLDSNLKMPLTAKILQQDGDTLVVCATDHIEKRQQLKAAGATVLKLAGKDQRIDLTALLKWLAKEKGCNQVMVEAGATLSGSFIEQGLVDELHIFQAPVLLGSSAKPLLNLDLSTMANKRELVLIDSRKVGSDTWLRYRC
ncbi:MAG: diaminohydroxyphosphoribosylaminopyrimidine deaminase [Chitinophagales bacterium]|jgi:diaminohydroxyphosphoribosylaminopyrimidine deaminase/5-amino-6-(5-phosphoribosylamino)uracil reductase